MSDNVIVIKAKPERKVFKSAKVTKIPESILNNPKLQAACQRLPANYNFELPKTIWKVTELKAKTIALQMPEGLLLFSTTIADIIKEFTDTEVVIMGDVTYGACCIDDLTARALGVELLIHYGHSCLVPMDQICGIKVLYVFVDIKIDPLHFINTVKHNFNTSIKIALVSTIQFVTTLQATAKILKECGYNVFIPQIKPLSPGEILGCTAPVVKCADVIIYLGDGRFHLEAAMIVNPMLDAYKYDPYSKKFTKESYAHEDMKRSRAQAIYEASAIKIIGIVMGTLGRQGSSKVVNYLEEELRRNDKTVVTILLSEIFPKKLQHFTQIGAFVQIACPRLSIDWGESFPMPVLTPYEAAVLCKKAQFLIDNNIYPMDFYATASLGHWTPNHKPHIDSTNKCCGKCPK